MLKAQEKDIWKKGVKADQQEIQELAIIAHKAESDFVEVKQHYDRWQKQVDEQNWPITIQLITVKVMPIENKELKMMPIQGPDSPQLRYMQESLCQKARLQEGNNALNTFGFFVYLSNLFAHI